MTLKIIKLEFSFGIYYFHLPTGGCSRFVKFVSPVNGHALDGHMFKNLTIGTYTQCEELCVREKECVSVNIGPTTNDGVICELSDSDHLKHLENLKPRNGWTYRGTEVRIVHIREMMVMMLIM